MRDTIRLFTDEELALRHVVDPIAELSGIDDELESLRLGNLHDALAALDQLLREARPERNECDLTLFAGLMSILKDEAARVRLRNSLGGDDRALLRDALLTAALEMRDRRRMPRAA